jgi:hypothetical protein
MDKVHKPSDSEMKRLGLIEESTCHLPGGAKINLLDSRRPGRDTNPSTFRIKFESFTAIQPSPLHDHAVKLPISRVI